MIINKVDLQNFRNYKKRTFEFSEGINLVVGDNAVGKTNLLEAIYLLASGKSFRVKSVEREMIGYGEEIARVIGQTGKDKGNEKTIEIVLTTGEVSGEKVGKKRYLVEGVSKRAYDFLGNFLAVYFGPEDLELVTDSPSLRRKYLDSVLVQVDREYARCLLAYEKGLRSRNKILEGIRERGNGIGGYNGNESDRRRLYYWDQLLIKNGNVITQKRGEFIDYLNGTIDSTGSDDGIVGFGGIKFKIEYDLSGISEERLKQYETEEVAAATTLVGPHRDDFSLRIKNTGDRIENKERDLSVYGSGDEPFDSAQSKPAESRDLSVYGSRGEQRLAILWLKLGELAYIEKEAGDKPVLLLDDIFSELDERHRKLVLKLIDKQQTLLTTADNEVKDMVLGKGGEDIKVAEIG